MLRETKKRQRCKRAPKKSEKKDEKARKKMKEREKKTKEREKNRRRIGLETGRDKAKWDTKSSLIILLNFNFGTVKTFWVAFPADFGKNAKKFHYHCAFSAVSTSDIARRKRKSFQQNLQLK